MKLSKLVQEIPFSFGPIVGDPEITGIVSDSRQIVPGNLFVAIAGGSTDGHRYIPAAIERGAVAVAGSKEFSKLSVPYLLFQDSRKALPHLAAAFYGFPGRKLTVIGVTGTDGKTTTTNLIYSILQAAGIKVGMISTINAVIGDRIMDTGFHVTTPDAPDIQHYLAQMVDAGLTHVVLEVTSHGLSQYRVDACEVDVAVITNITHEHLDYHGSFESYRSAKSRLFASLMSTSPKVHGNPRMSVLNRDDASFHYFSQRSPGSILTYGFSQEADIQADRFDQEENGIRFMVSGRGLEILVNSNLFGDFNISNCLAAITATVYALDISPDAAQAGIASLNYIPGRMELIDMGQQFKAIVDFAHTPNALQKALETARRMTPGKLIAVFGSAGLRDRQKRRMMAEKSLELADITILTAEDPRTESLDEILAEMASGALFKGGIEGKNFWRIPDRGEAIRHAISLAQPGDVVIACGKGHEQSMCFEESEFPWDDRIAIQAALSEILCIPGPKMPYLPTQDV